MIENQKELERKFLSEETTKILGHTTLCIIILDKNFDIVKITKNCIDLFADYYNLTIKNFFDIFKVAFKKNEVDKCINDLGSKEKSFSWKGKLCHKSQILKSLYTKLFFIPIFYKNELLGWFAIFEDITDEFISGRTKILKGLLRTSKMKDKDTGNHTLRVNYYAKLLTSYMYKKHLYPEIINADFVENIGLYAALHDIGKIGTPDYILQKPDELNEHEWKIMQEHTINGAMILSSFELPMAQDIAIAHHERWDGKGYPFRISGKLIPLSARITTIGDVYDALRTQRPYKDIMPHKEVVEMMISESETHFDPELIEIFKKIHKYFDQVWKRLEDSKINASKTKTEHFRYS